ncbi:MAG: SpoIIE family protein phosphatase [Acidobacteria bacterium]|nr:SpoIIE family protein phosphatase [Acidobacteriota bacterium]MBV9478641.1 SpoIIE family protein phosphatase [Acidobacteriota bacterium]
MRIRTQLILAAFVLAVIPLAAIVTYSYHSSRRALESAYRHEAERLTKQMDRRLAGIRAELDQRLSVVSALPLPADKSDTGDVGNIVSVMGDAASFVDSLEFHPVPKEELDRIAAEAKKSAELAQLRTARPRIVVRAQHEDEANADHDPADHDDDADDDKTEVAQLGSTAPAAPAQPTAPASPGLPAMPTPPAAPMIIDLPQVPAVPYVMSEEQQELLNEISNVGAQLGDTNLDTEDREDLQKELAQLQKRLRAASEKDRVQYRQRIHQALDVARQQQRELMVRRGAQPLPLSRKAPLSPNLQPLPVPKAAPDATASAPASATATLAASGGKPAPTANIRALTPKDAAKSAVQDEKTALILGRQFKLPVRQQGHVVGQLSASVSPDQVIRRILGASDDGGEIPFAVDRAGNVYTRSTAERTQLDRLHIPERVRRGENIKGIQGWIVSTSIDAPSGMRIGVARPVGDNLDELQRTAAQNFGLGLGLIAFALIGIVPLSNHLTRDVKTVIEGADRIAHGDLMTRVPVKTNNELGQLARAFNRMAEDLSLNQMRLLQQERAQKEQELQQRLLAVEYERKSVELEDARAFQLSMLPKEVPRHPRYEVAVFTQTATEVGGDYYDFRVEGDVLAVTIGDATGHGAKAGTMVTVIKTLFAGYGAATAPSEFLGDAAEKIKRMELGRMAMALSLGRFEQRTLTLASAGMPPVFVHRAATADVDEIVLAATPLGTLGVDYAQTDVALAAGDTVLFLSDGFPELMNDAGQQLGYAAAMEAFSSAAKAGSAGDVIEALEAAARRWHGDGPPNDDVTFVVVRVA